MGKRENLCGLSVTAVDENKRCQVVADRKPSKFLDRQRAGWVVPYNAAAHDQNPEKFRALNERNKKVLPCAALMSQFLVNFELVGHISCNSSNIVTSAETSDERQFVSFSPLLKFSVPALTQ